MSKFRRNISHGCSVVGSGLPFTGTAIPFPWSSSVLDAVPVKDGWLVNDKYRFYFPSEEDLYLEFQFAQPDDDGFNREYLYDNILVLIGVRKTINWK